MAEARLPVRLGLSNALRDGALALAVALVLVACQGTDRTPAGASGSGDRERLNVVATTTVFADIVRQVGGDRVDVTSIIPAGVGPEDYESRPADARILADADLVVSNGAGLDDFLSEGIPVLTVDGEANPHVWLDPTLVADFFVPSIKARLAELDPGGASDYEATLESSPAIVKVS